MALVPYHAHTTQERKERERREEKGKREGRREREKERGEKRRGRERERREKRKREREREEREILCFSGVDTFFCSIIYVFAKRMGLIYLKIYTIFVIRNDLFLVFFGISIIS